MLLPDGKSSSRDNSADDEAAPRPPDDIDPPPDCSAQHLTYGEGGTHRCYDDDRRVERQRPQDLTAEQSPTGSTQAAGRRHQVEAVQDPVRQVDRRRYEPGERSERDRCGEGRYEPRVSIRRHHLEPKGGQHG